MAELLDEAEFKLVPTAGPSGVARRKWLEGLFDEGWAAEVPEKFKWHPSQRNHPNFVNHLNSLNMKLLQQSLAQLTVPRDQTKARTVAGTPAEDLKAVLPPDIPSLSLAASKKDSRKEETKQQRLESRQPTIRISRATAMASEAVTVTSSSLATSENDQESEAASALNGTGDHLAVAGASRSARQGLSHRESAMQSLFELIKEFSPSFHDSLAQEENKR